MAVLPEPGLTTAIFMRFTGWRPMWVKMLSSGLFGVPWTTVRYCFLVDLSANWATMALWVVSVLATTMHPEVSLSRR